MLLMAAACRNIWAGAGACDPLGLPGASRGVRVCLRRPSRCLGASFLAQQTNPQTFEVSVFGQTFKGAGGAAIIWVLMTTIGIVAIGHYWVP